MEKDSGEGLRGAEKKEAFHQEAESKIHSFSFNPPKVEFATAKKKVHIKLAGTNSCRASIQILHKGGENNLHYHPNMDLIYMVLKGRIKFYGPGDKLIGDYGANEGLLLPENSRYWFESVGDEEAWLMQIAGFPKGVEAYKRVAVEPPKHGDGGEGSWFSLTTGETMTDAEAQQREMREIAK
jgi:mannose-6-phosphate isomerase-like protein (cupin superfamily)